MAERSGWLPLSVRQGRSAAAIESYEALVAGVPEYARESLLRWIEDYAREVGPDALAELILLLECNLHRGLGGSTLKPGGHEVFRRMYAVGMRPPEMEDFRRRLSHDPNLLLDVIDLTASAMAANPQHVQHQEWLRRLRIILDEAGLEVMLLQSEEFCGLVRRVDTTSGARIAAAAAKPDRAAVHLAAAWAAAYGRHPNPSLAYREAVRAVEAAGKPLISPKNARTSVGTMKRDLRAKPENWRHVLCDDATAGVEPVATMMDLLWNGQLDRHGTDDNRVPLTVSPEQAEAAVHIALTLVEWFRSGALQRV
jgi:hypothetical protein